jgi:hypothetical protein
MSCNLLIDADFKDPASFQAWRGSQSAAINQIANSVTTTQTDYNNLVNIATNINNHLKCIKEKYDNANNVANVIAELQSKIDDVQKLIEERKKDVSVAHDRALLVRSPEISRSYYDGWFPIDRPLKHYTIPVLISFSIFLLTLSLFYLLVFLGIHTRFIIKLPDFDRSGYHGSPVINTISGNRPFWAMIIISIVLLGLTIYGFTK